MFAIRVEPEGTARLSGRLDADEAETALEELQALPGPLILDCSELQYISSAGLGVVLQTYKRLNAAGHELRIVNLQPKVKIVFTYAGLHRLLQIE